MAEALKDYNRLIKWVTSLHVWHDAQRKKVRKRSKLGSDRKQFSRETTSLHSMSILNISAYKW